MNMREEFEAEYSKGDFGIAGCDLSKHADGSYINDDAFSAFFWFKAGLAHANVNEQSQAQQSPKMQFLDRSKEKIITLLWQGICDGTVEAFDVNGMMVIPSEQGVTYVRKEDVISFFGLVEPSQAQQPAKPFIYISEDEFAWRSKSGDLNGTRSLTCITPQHFGEKHYGNFTVPLYLQPQAQQPSTELKEMEARKDAAYLERNQVVAALAKCFPSGTAKTAIEGWSEDWHSCVYIDLPTGQASWHYHDSQAYLFADLPAYAGKWDGHTTEEKYSRIAKLQSQAQQESKPCAYYVENCFGERVMYTQKDHAIRYAKAANIREDQIFALYAKPLPPAPEGGE